MIGGDGSLVGGIAGNWRQGECIVFVFCHLLELEEELTGIEKPCQDTAEDKIDKESLLGWVDKWTGRDC